MQVLITYDYSLDVYLVASISMYYYGYPKRQYTKLPLEETTAFFGILVQKRVIVRQALLAIYC